MRPLRPDPSHLLSHALSWRDHEVLFFPVKTTGRGPLGKPRFDGVPAPARRAAKRAGAAPNYPTPREAREAGAAGQGGAPLPFRISLTQLGQPGFSCAQLPVQDEMHQPDPVSPEPLSRTETVSRDLSL